MNAIDLDIEINLNSAAGPVVIVGADVLVEELLNELPEGWTIHPDDFYNGVGLGDGRTSFPLSEATA